MKNKSIMTKVAASTLAVTALVGMAGTAAYAADDTSKPKPGLTAPSASEIAKHEASRKAGLEKRLDSAINDGKITAEQKTAILNFFKDNKPDVTKDMTRDEHKAAMDAFKDKVEKFATDNNIDLELLKPAGGPGGHGPDGRGHGEHRGPGGPEGRGGPGAPDSSDA